MELLMKMNSDPETKLKVHIGISIDHKKFPKLKKWTLGAQLQISLYPIDDDGDEPIHMHHLIDLVDCNNPFIADKSPQMTAVYLKEIMDKLGLWNITHLPEINICCDGGLSFAIIHHLQRLGWENASQCVITCDGHTAVNFVKQTRQHVSNVGKSACWTGKFLPLGVKILIFIF